MLAGTLTGVSASLNLAQKSSAQPGEVTITPLVVQPSQTKATFDTNSRWRGIQVQKIKATNLQIANRGLNGFPITKNDVSVNADASTSTVKTDAIKP